LIQNHLRGFEPDPARVDEMYRKMSREVRLVSLIFSKGPEAEKFLAEVKEDDFEQVAKRWIEAGKVTEKKDDAYVKIKDLRSAVAEEVFSMDIGGLSKIYRTDDGFLVYRLLDARFVEDPPVREEAVTIVSDMARREKSLEYSKVLQEKYVTIDEELFKQLDFDADLEKLLQDTRVVAKGKGKDPFAITVADLAGRMSAGFFHGADKAQKSKKINERKEVALANMLFIYTSDLEARHLGLDQTEEFKRKVEEFERSAIFSAFISKVLLPKIKVNEEEVRAYYDQHPEEYSSPAMLRLQSLVFDNQRNAETSLDKLRKGADFNWVSANATGLVDPESKKILRLDKAQLSMTALPEDLRETAADLKKGDSLVYAPPQEDFYYLLRVEEVYPPQLQPYEQARAEAAKKVYGLNSQKALEEWTTKLKEAYPVRILLTEPAR
jgi:hypothetical protein